jgi:hypothetical protein
LVRIIATRQIHIPKSGSEGYIQVAVVSIMNAFRPPGLLKNLLLPTIALLLCLTGMLRADPADDSRAKEATTAAGQWLAEIDANKVEESYEQGCTAFHNKVSKQQWITVLKALRPSIGNLTSRSEQSAEYKPDGFEGLEGECVVIKYSSVFTVIGPALEVVVMKREDGQWRGAGYNVQPQSSGTQ